MNSTTVPVSSIELERLEGLTAECLTVTVPDFAKANATLREWSHTAPKGRRAGYHKCAFVVTFADGETYSGRFDLTDEPERLETHIRAHLVAFSGTAPAHRTQEQWDRFLNDCVPVAKRAEAARFLATYELG